MSTKASALLEVSTLLKSFEEDRDLLGLYCYTNKVLGVLKRVGKIIRSVDPQSGDFRIMAGTRKRAPEPFFTISSNLVGAAGEYSWLTVLRMAESILAPLVSPEDVDEIAGTEELNCSSRPSDEISGESPMDGGSLPWEEVCDDTDSLVDEMMSTTSATCLLRSSPNGSRLHRLMVQSSSTPL